MEPPLESNCLVLNRQRKHPIDTVKVRAFLANAIVELGVAALPFSVVFITDKEIRRYNRVYRGFDKPTDVLSFSAVPVVRPGRRRKRQTGWDDGCDWGYLGDILISSETAYNQARKSRTLSFETNIRRLVLHGLLHLMGYDHETDSGQMRRMERRFRRKFRC